MDRLTQGKFNCQLGAATFSQSFCHKAEDSGLGIETTNDHMPEQRAQ